MAGPGAGGHHARMRRRYTGKQRSDLVDLVTGGHATVPEAAARFGVAASTAYQWLQRWRRATRGGVAANVADSVLVPKFARLVPSSAASSVVVKVGAAEIEVRHGFDAGLLRAVVASLAEGAK